MKTSTTLGIYPITMTDSSLVICRKCGNEVMVMDAEMIHPRRGYICMSCRIAIARDRKAYRDSRKTPPRKSGSRRNLWKSCDWSGTKYPTLQCSCGFIGPCFLFNRVDGNSEIKECPECHHKRVRKNRHKNRFTQQEWKDLCEHYQNKCLCCGTAGDWRSLTADHVIPLCYGGTNNIGNIQPLCKSCNSIKGHRYIDFRTEERRIS